MFCAIVNVTHRWDSTKLNDILILKRITKKSPFLFWTEPAAITYFVVRPSIIAKSPLRCAETLPTAPTLCYKLTGGRHQHSRNLLNL
uniref:Uncharacterized protein n=1 Tax=Daphnia galeata TaxID=27404 RepID=A0A8J2RHG2_9CRUS|nr:unnamed protein product [Daphnia galeata]